MKITSLLLALVALVTPVMADAPDFRPLFNGKDLTGWKGRGYIVKDGAIVSTPKGNNLVTEETFQTPRFS